MTAYVSSRDLPVILHFPDDSADAVAKWVKKAIEEGRLHLFTVAGSGTAIVNFAGVTSTMVSASEPAHGVALTVGLNLSELDPPPPAPATASVAIPRGRISDRRPSPF